MKYLRVAVIAVCGLAWATPCCAAGFLISVQGNGVGTDRHAADYGHPPVQYASFSGFFSFDPSLATPFGNGLRYNSDTIDPLGNSMDLLASVQGDTLCLHSVVDWTATPAPAIDEASLKIFFFEPGYLNAQFPLFYDASKLISTSYTAYNFYDDPHHHFFTSTGNITCVGLTNGIGSAELSAWIHVAPTGIGAVPEPATWTVIILGFGLIGIAMRVPIGGKG